MAAQNKFAGKKEKSDPAPFKNLKSDLKNGTVGNLYAFFGDETYLRDFYYGELKKQLLAQAPEEFNCHELRGKTITAADVADAANLLPMMSARTLVTVFDYDLFKADESERNAFQALFEDIPDYCCIVFFYDTIPFNKPGNTTLGKVFKKVGSLVEFIPQGDSDLVAWVRRHFKAAGKEISNELSLYLIQRCGSLMTNLNTEIEKISAYSRHREITVQDIDAVTEPQLSAVVFDLSGAIAAGDKTRAADILGQLLQRKEAEQAILFIMEKHFIQLYAARLFLEKRGSESELAEALQVQPWLAGKLFQQARRFSLAWCRQAVIACTEADFRSKSVGSSGANAELMSLFLNLVRTRS